MSVLVVLEQSGGQFHRMGWEAVVAAGELGLPVSVATIGPAGEAAAKAVATVFAIQHAALETYSADGYTAALCRRPIRCAISPRNWRHDSGGIWSVTW